MDTIDPATGEIVDRRQPTIPPVVAAAIIAVKKQIKQLGHDERNQQGGYNSVSVDKMYANIGPVMAEAGLALLIDESGTEVKANEKTGNPWLFAHYDCRFVHESGAVSPVMRRSIAMPISGPQAFGAAQSYIEKQLLRQVFKVPTGERDADATAPSEDAPTSRSGAATARGSASGGASTYQRTQAAPAPSEAQADAQKRYREIRGEIDASMTLADLDGVPKMLAWVLMEKAVRAIEAKERADELMTLLANRIESRREMLMQPPPADEGAY